MEQLLTTIQKKYSWDIEGQCKILWADKALAEGCDHDIVAEYILIRLCGAKHEKAN